MCDKTEREVKCKGLSKHYKIEATCKERNTQGAQSHRSSRSTSMKWISYLIVVELSFTGKDSDSALSACTQIITRSENMTWNWNIEFVDVTVNREDLTGGQYDYILLQLRSRLEDDCVSSGGNTCPVLPEYTTNNDRVRWFEIRLYLANPSTRIRLRFRRDDLYLVGYQVNEQQWREFNSEDGSQTHLIDGSQFLGFTGSYEHLTNEAHIRLNQVTVGGQSLVNAAYSLATATSREAIAKALLVMILMFSEAARFRPVQNYMQRNFMDGATVPDWIDDLIHRWGTLSGNAMYYSRNPQAPWVNQNLEIEGPGPNYDMVTVVLRTLGQLLFYMGILQNNPKNFGPPR